MVESRPVKAETDNQRPPISMREIRTAILEVLAARCGMIFQHTWHIQSNKERKLKKSRKLYDCYYCWVTVAVPIPFTVTVAGPIGVDTGFPFGPFGPFGSSA